MSYNMARDKSADVLISQRRSVGFHIENEPFSALRAPSAVPGLRSSRGTPVERRGGLLHQPSMAGSPGERGFEGSVTAGSSEAARTR